MAGMGKRKIDVHPARSQQGKLARATQERGVNAAHPRHAAALRAQTRKVLLRHYRARHGVK